MLAPTQCFHCGEPVPPGTDFVVRLENEDRPVCCGGCKAAAEFIRDAGLADYYRFRDAPAPRPDAQADDAWVTYDRPEVQQRLVAATGGALSVNLLLEGIRCAACSWLVERRLERTAGVTGIHVNPASGRARLEWRADATRLSTLLRTIQALGYRPHVLGATDTVEVAMRERRQALKRLVIAGFGMMQVMMFAVAMYAGAFDGMDPVLRQYLRLVSMIVATPVLVYAGRPFLEGAWRGLTARQLGMDVPVALALVLAYAASTWNTFAGRGEVYFDSVTMFVFLLLLGRFAEMSARHRASSTSDALVRLQPALATRVQGSGVERVPVDALSPLDELVVPAGEPFPVDGILCRGQTAADESLLTGEAAPVAKTPGDAVIGGSINALQPVHMRVTAIGHDTVLAGIVRLLERAQTERPAIARIADRWATWFVAAVLAAAALVAGGWMLIAPEHAFEATLAVLVVTCPCALSLATPTAITAATAALARRGLLVTRADALETLAGIDTVVLDKTGTLTAGRPQVTGCRPLGPMDADTCLGIAAALEQSSSHPLARAFRDLPGPLPVASDLSTHAGLGLEGNVAGVRHRIGRRDWVAEFAGPATAGPDRGLYLARRGQWLALIEVEDPLRRSAIVATEELRELGVEVVVASGDHAAAVTDVATRIGATQGHSRLDPAGKLELVERLHRGGRKVAMIGDGVNDAPVLAAASVSIAMGAGAAIAQTSADAVLMTSDLAALPDALRRARHTVAVIRQNLAWAAAYNLAALPLAAFGFIPPWAAAIGMSASSLLVVANATRLRRGERPSDAGVAATALGTAP